MAVSLLALLNACSGVGFINAVTPRSGYTRTADIAFGSDGLKLDVYQPASAAGAAPLVVFFYGGSWQTGKTLPKDRYKFAAQALAGEGYVTVVPDYRLYPQVKWPVFLDDCAQAVVWAREHARAFGADPDKLVLIGHSAGADNAVTLALDPRYLQRAGGDRAWIRGVVGLAGPYDFLPLTDPALQDVFGPREQWPRTQPIHYVDAAAPPMLLIAGQDDDVVLVKNTNNLYAALASEGTPAARETRKLVYPSMGHVKLVALMSVRLPGHAALFDPLRRFVNEVTGGSRADTAGP